MNPRAACFCRVLCWLGARLPAWLRVLGLLVLLSVQAASGELPGQAAPPPARPTPPEYLYTGQQFDPDLGLYYLRARYHNPDSGRFWTADAFEGSASDPASLHRYTYCQNNPVNCVDPSGYSTSGGEAATVSGLAPMVRSTLFKALGNLALGGWIGYGDAALNGGDVGMGALIGASVGVIAPVIVPARVLGSLALRWGLTGIGGIAAATSLYEGHPLGAAYRAALVATPWLLATQGARNMVQALTEYYSSPVMVRAARTPVSPPNHSNWGSETAETAEAAFGRSLSVSEAPAGGGGSLVHVGERGVLQQGQFVNRVFDSRSGLPGAPVSGPLGRSFSPGSGVPTTASEAIQQRGLNIFYPNNAQQAAVYRAMSDIPTINRTSIGGSSPEVLIDPRYFNQLEQVQTFALPR